MLEICLYYTRDVCFSSFYFYTILILEAWNIPRFTVYCIANFYSKQVY
jgi:hypothetical protein